MKKTNFYKSIALIGAAAFILGSCDRDIKDFTPFDTNINSSAQLKVYNATSSTVRNSVYIDGKSINFAVVGTNTSFPANASNPSVLIQPGSHTVTIKDTLPTATQPVITFTQNFEAGKYYSIYAYDTVSAPKYKVVEGPVPNMADTTVKVRLAHFSFLKNATAPAIDVFSKNKNANIFTNVGFGQVTNYMNITSGLSDSLIVREAGSTSINLDTLVFSPSPRRTYTLLFNGRYMSNGTAGATLPRTLISTIDY